MNFITASNNTSSVSVRVRVLFKFTFYVLYVEIMLDEKIEQSIN